MHLRVNIIIKAENNAYTYGQRIGEKGQINKFLIIDHYKKGENIIFHF